MMTAPKISDFMTASPHLIGAEQPLARAHDIMRKNDLRHLPVLHGGKLVGSEIGTQLVVEVHWPVL